MRVIFDQKTGTQAGKWWH